MPAHEREAEVQAVERFDPGSGQAGGLLAAEHVARYTWAGALATGKRVLDAGCGTGYGSELLARSGAIDVVGIDIDAETVAAAGRAAPQATFEVADVRELPAALGEFDLIVCFEVLEHLDDPTAALDRLAQALRPDGVLAVSSPNRDVYPPGNPYHRHEFTPYELAQELAARFDHSKLVRQQDWLATGLFEDTDFARAEGVAVEVAKAVPGEPGDELYTIGLAGNSPLPPTPPFVLLTTTADVKWWQQRVEALRDELDAKGRHVEQLEEWLHQKEAELEAAHESYTETITAMQATTVWRLGARYWALRDRILGRSRTRS